MQKLLKNGGFLSVEYKKLRAENRIDGVFDLVEYGKIPKDAEKLGDKRKKRWNKNDEDFVNRR